MTLQEECTRVMVSAALLRVDHEMTEKQARTTFCHGIRRVHCTLSVKSA